MTKKTISQLDAAQSLNDNMVIAVQDTNNTYKTTLADVKAYCGGSSDKYKIGDRVKDDSNNPVGTVSSIFTDGNGDRYAVVCLDAQYRLAGGKISDSDTDFSTLPAYNDLSKWSATETATENTTGILNVDSYSPACMHCRTKYFTIDGVTYYGQLPNIIELVDLYTQRITIEENDPTASSYPSLIIPTAAKVWSSSFSNDGRYQRFDIMNQSGTTYNNSSTTSNFVIPVLEIPL